MSHAYAWLRKRRVVAIALAVFLLLVLSLQFAKVTSFFTSVLIAQEQSNGSDTERAVDNGSGNDDDRRNQDNHIKNQKNYLKDLKRQIQDVLRQAKDVDVSVANDSLGKFESCLSKLEPQIGTPDFWNNWQECSDYSRTLEEELNDNLRPKQRCAELKKNISDRKREIKNNIEKQKKDLLRNDKNADLSQLDGIKAKIDENIAKADQAGAACTQDDVDNLDTISGDLNGFFQDWYDSFNTLNEEANNKRRESENKKQFDKDIKSQCKNKSREFTNYEKEFLKAKKSATVSSETEEAYNKVKQNYEDMCVSKLQGMESALNSGDMDAFDDLRQEFWDSDRDFWDAMNESRNELNEQRQSKDALRELEQKEKDLVKMKKEYERVKKEKPNANIDKILKDFEDTINHAKEEANSDPQSFWNTYQQDLNDMNNDFWNSQQQAQNAKNISRWLKDVAKDVNFRQTDLKRFKRECPDSYSSLQEVYNNMRQAVNEAEANIESDSGKSEELLHSVDELRMEWDDVSRSCWEGKQITFELENTLREIDYAGSVIGEMLEQSKLSAEEADVCRSFLTDARTQVEAVRTAEDANALQGLEEEGNRVCPVLRDLGEAPPPDREYYKNFVDQHVKGVDKDMAADVLEKISAEMINKIVARLLSDPSAIENLLRAAGDKNQAAVAGALEAATSFYDDSEQRDLLAKKAEILELTKQLEDVKVNLRLARDKLAELQSLQDEISSYNFYGNGGDTIRTEIESFLERARTSGMSKEEIRTRIAELKAKKEEAIQSSKQAKFDAKKIPFMDTDDNIWYTKFVAPLAKMGIVQGKGDGLFDPGAQVTVAEVLTMAFRISGDAETEGQSALCDGRYSDHWANRFVAWAEQKGLDVVGTCTDINRPALRWEVAQILLQTANSDIPSTNEVCFSDVSANKVTENSVSCAARTAGIMKGVDGKGRVFAPVIRAEAATMVKTAGERLLGIDFSSEESDEGESISADQTSQEDEDESVDEEDVEDEDGDSEEEL